MDLSLEKSRICSYLLNPNDLDLSDEILQDGLDNGIRISIEFDHPAIRIISVAPLMLSQITPILHDFGFMIQDEISYFIEYQDQQLSVCRFSLMEFDLQKLKNSALNIERIIYVMLKENTAFISCKILSLVYHQNLSFREITLLRAFMEYLNQSVISIGYDVFLQTYTRNSYLSALFVEFFLTKFDPDIKNREKSLSQLSIRIEEEIKQVPVITEDRILKLTFALLHDIVRTNYFMNRDSIAIKINAASFGQNLKGIQPKIETFVFHPIFNGLHLRMSTISRGGLRWSERLEDYRQEIKSLMITQHGKNSIIVPEGAKGGFVIKKEKESVTKELFNDVYSEFIHNLLDVVDNYDNAQFVRNPLIVAYDEEDSYFVVAADKGTANMSDVANEIAINRNYWLGDAFASGGSNGFGHKLLGVTAKGALRSSQRFFIEEGIDIYKDTVKVVGIGSMSGDVFGNGVLISKRFQLVGAISHNQIFVDPNPPLEAFEERQRLFELGLGWGHYQKEMISKGGGVFSRSEKSIILSPEIKKMLHITKSAISGEELARKLLCMKVDLLFNGGVGTYVKSSEESDLDLGDKQNEGVRVDALDLRARIVCEGGNLGFTPKARIEYALNGGKINLDGIDNAAGVNTSDHEVNIKILLNALVSKGIMTDHERNQLLKSSIEPVLNAVLWNNYAQSLAISRDQHLSRNNTEEFIRVVEVLEQYSNVFKRRDFLIPKNENFEEIIDATGAIIRPVLSSLISYSKIVLQSLLLESNMVDEQLLQPYLFKYFPKSIVGAYDSEIVNHPLRREIIAMVVADTMINRQGSLFLKDLIEIGEEQFLLKVKSWLVINQLFGANDIRHEIFRQDYRMTVAKQYELLNLVESSILFSSRWLVRFMQEHFVDLSHLSAHKEALFSVIEKLPHKHVPQLIEENQEFNRFFASIDYIRFSIAVMMIQEGSHHTFENVATVLYSTLDAFHILALMEELDKLEVINVEDKLLKAQSAFFLEFVLIHYTRQILHFQRVNEDPKTAFEQYMQNENGSLHEIRNNLKEMKTKELSSILVMIQKLVISAIQSE